MNALTIEFGRGGEHVVLGSLVENFGWIDAA
jgi:hypothetical protein